MLSIAKHLCSIHSELCMAEMKSLKVLRYTQHDKYYLKDVCSHPLSAQRREDRPAQRSRGEFTRVQVLGRPR
jgi:hypothetical protein